MRFEGRGESVSRGFAYWPQIELENAEGRRADAPIVGAQFTECGGGRWWCGCAEMELQQLVPGIATKLACASCRLASSAQLQLPADWRQIHRRQQKN